jgi:hypothetical protein
MQPQSLTTNRYANKVIKRQVIYELPTLNRRF